jgi:hypothetical protein
LHAPVALGAHGAIAFWPLAAALVTGAIEAAGLLRDRRLARLAPVFPPADPGLPDQGR